MFMCIFQILASAVSPEHTFTRVTIVVYEYDWKITIITDYILYKYIFNVTIKA